MRFIDIMKASTFGILLSLCSCAPLLHNDVTTNPDKPLCFRTLAKDADSSCNRSDFLQNQFNWQKRSYPDLQPLKLSLPVEAVFETVKVTAAAMPDWQVISVEAGDFVLEAVVRSRTFRFKDDVIIEVSEAGEDVIVNMRSRSRIGIGDFGVNASRIRNFMSRLKATTNG